VTYLLMTTHPGGAATSFAHLLGALEGRGVARRVVLLGPAHPGPLHERVVASCEAFQQVPLPSLYHGPGNWLSPRRWRRLLRRSRSGVAALVGALRAHPPDLIHVNTTAYAQALGRIRAALPGVPLLVHAREVLRSRGPGDPVSAWIGRETARHATGIVAISENEQLPFLTHPWTRVLENPVDVGAAERCPRGALRARLGARADELLVGMIAQLVPEKGHLDFLRAAQRVLERHPGLPVRFVLIGAHERPRWRRALARLLPRPGFATQVERAIGLLPGRERVHLLPYTDRPLEALTDLDVVVRPSLAGDPWGRDVIEALACGRPVVATGTSQVYVREGATGFLVPAGDVDALAERVGRLLLDPALREAMGRRGRALVRERCDLRGWGERLMGLYAEMLRSRGGVG
jgi:glycosyltransferase involved in cell wall biosynthesis